MNKPSSIIFNNKKEIILTVFFCFFFTSVLMAQSDRDRIPQEVPRGNDNAIVNDSPEGSFDSRNEAVRNTAAMPNKDNNPAANNNNKKDNLPYNKGNDKELKKEGMSTLSFNLFLYIVDKFRED